MHHSIGINQCLLARGMQVDPNCFRCHSEAESILHALRDCPLSKSVWDQLGRRTSNPPFFSQNLHDWLNVNATSGQQYTTGQIPWNLVFLFGIWFLWKGRNQLLFNNKNQNPNLAKEIVDRAAEYHFCANISLEKRLVLKSVKWEKPGYGWLTLNTDGSVAGNFGVARGGGLIRDTNGEWVTGFARKIGKTSSFQAELWALRDGLQLCLQYQAPAVLIDLDSKTIVDALNSQDYSKSIVSSIMEDCKYMISRIPQTRCRHVYREANRCADFLAKVGTSIEGDFIVFHSPPVDLISILEDDAIGVHVNRLCPAPSFAV